ncbi:hypothetical protein [Myxosarcina sp. GI1]|uniref:hypothetical protein n=1 Tax=Myxosarcina sp. GI1 TaxID=1541065 RepID=UPI0005682D31|nr:hypothetical protein [Myxosarcina sp. GI1]
MSTKWLAIQSFQYDRSLIAAINTLSIQLKLELAGITNLEKARLAEEARTTLYSFLEKLESLIGDSEPVSINPLIGTSHGLRQLAQRFVSAKNARSEFHSVLFQQASRISRGNLGISSLQSTLSQTKVLLHSEIAEDKKALISCLQELRRLVEEHINLDTETILGEV